MRKLSVLILSLSLGSCWEREEILPNSSGGFIENNCVTEDFAQGQDDNVYGLACIEGKQLVIKTAEKVIDPVKISSIADSNNLEIADDVDFMGKFYAPSYQILEGKGDDKEIPFLLKFLPEDEEFIGNKDTKYRIIFKTKGNYLVLYKASKNLEDIPFIERTSLEKEKGYYMVPFIGYNIKYCEPETLRNRQTNEKTKKSRINCEDSHLQSSKYIQVKISSKTAYDYKKGEKMNFFPADYFKGNWYFSIGLIESPSQAGEKSTSIAELVKIIPHPEQMFLVDDSGKLALDTDKEVVFKLPVTWLSFEAALNGKGTWSKFGERSEINPTDEIESDYVRLNLSQMTSLATPLGEINLGWSGIPIEITSTIDLLEDFRIEKNYLSFSYRATLNADKFPPGIKDLLHGKQAKWKISLLRLDSIEESGFVPRKSFVKDSMESRVFGAFPVFSQKIKGIGETSDEDKYSHARIKRFNIGLTSAQKKADRPDKPFKTLKWYFSKNSTKNPNYRATARRAVDIYDRAFKYISHGKIGVKLIEEEEKELGDLRYNLINLVEKDANLDSGILGWGPSYANRNTGQILGSSANIFITEEKIGWFNVIRNYVRYELFEKDQNSAELNKIHAVSPLTKNLIEDKCGKGKIKKGNVVKFVAENKAKVKDKSINRGSNLKNRKIILACVEMVIERSLLNLILHEMGHNFGLTHNFKASADSKNYFQSPEEIKKIFGDDFKFNEQLLARSSSVMDYILTKVYPGMEYLGKYDLAALRYLYLDELEGKNGELISLNINPDPNQQFPLTAQQLKERKDYLHCPDNFNNKEPFCKSHDYGSTPAEIVTNSMTSAKMIFNILRYRYDKSNKDYDVFDVAQMFLYPIFSNFIYYKHWEKLRDNHLKNQGFDPVYKLRDQALVDRYKKIIEVKEEESSSEYALYYPLRRMFFDWIMEVMSYEEMTCHVKETATGEQHQLALEDIKLFFENEENRKVANCKSFNDVFKNEGLTLEKQTGFEDFVSYYPYHPNKSINTASVSPIGDIFRPPGFVNHFKVSLVPELMSWAHEPDLLNEWYLRTGDSINLEKNRTGVGVLKSNTFLASYKSGLELVSDETEDKKEIKRELENYSFGFRKYQLEAGHDSSFDKLVEIPLSLRKPVDNPFLIEANKDYNDNLQEYSNFLTYLKTQKKHEIIITHVYNKEVLIVPYQKDSFSAKMIQEYHDKVSQLKQLNNKVESEKKPSLVDRVNKIVLERYTTGLFERIEDEAR